MAVETPPQPPAPSASWARAGESIPWPQVTLARHRSPFYRRWWFLTALAMVIVLLLASFAFALVIYSGPATLREPPPIEPAVLVDVTGREIGQIRPLEQRLPIPLLRIPKHVQDAFVTAEDRRFWRHRGVDPLALADAVIGGVTGSKFRGASTITQQYVKVTYVGNERSVRRKWREAVIAFRLERRYPKAKILEAYLNSIYLGYGAYGIEAAARSYFGKSASDLTIAQAALLAGVTEAPSRLSPRRNPVEARVRRDWVLERMAALGYISRAQADEAMREPITLERMRYPKSVHPLFVDWVRDELMSRMDEERVHSAGLRVQTTLDLVMQERAERAIDRVLGLPDDPDVSVVAVDRLTGEVRVMAGGTNKGPGEFNLATMARRHAGSAFKPLVLAAALENGKTLESTYPAPGRISLRFPAGRWNVSNYDKRGYGRLTLRNATAWSVNTVYAQLIRDVGPKKVVALGRRLGFRKLQPFPSLTLGTSGVSALEMATAFAAFGNGGIFTPPTGIRTVSARDQKGAHITALVPKRAMSPRTAEDVREALQSVLRYGTGRRLKVKDPQAGGKTGTTEEHRDAWFVGLAGRYSIAVWVGYAKRERPMTNVRGIRVVGGSFPGEIWSMVANALIDRDDGKILGGGGVCRANLQDPRAEVWGACVGRSDYLRAALEAAALAAELAALDPSIYLGGEYVPEPLDEYTPPPSIVDEGDFYDEYYPDEPEEDEPSEDPSPSPSPIVPPLP